MRFDPATVLVAGLQVVSFVIRASTTTKQKEGKFHKHFGSSPFVLASQWNDLFEYGLVSGNEANRRGLHSFLVAHYFLWCKPKNADILASGTNICERYARGAPVWNWVEKISQLADIKIVWPERFDDPNAEIFIVSDDGTDFMTWETPTEDNNIDTKAFSQKFNKAAFRYEIAIAIFESRVVWIRGPFRGGKSDKWTFVGNESAADIKFRVEKLGDLEPYDCLEDKIPDGKLAIADSGYSGSSKVSLVNPSEPRELKKFKARVKCRQETYNGRLKKYAILNTIFTYGAKKHRLALLAVATTIQYHMEDGDELFEP